jgi:phage gp45-like
MSSSDRNIRWGELTGESKDVGPYRLVEVEADGKKMDIMTIDPFGLQGSGHKDAQVLLLVPDGDEGKAVGIVMPRPKDRWDGLKPGEVGLKHFDKGQYLHHKDNGDTVIKTPNGILHLNPPD